MRTGPNHQGGLHATVKGLTAREKIIKTKNALVKNPGPEDQDFNGGTKKNHWKNKRVEVHCALFEQGHGAFSEVTDGRLSSLPDLSVGETAALSKARRMRRGQYSPADKSEAKTKPGVSEPQEKTPCPYVQ